MDYKLVVIATVAMVILLAVELVKGDVDDYSDPIQCYYCFGPAVNSSCADPVFPKEDKGKTLVPIECQSGICLKWTRYYNNELYMHRTCSHRLKAFKIMMIDGVCRSERTGNGYLCMCGRHLCNSADIKHHKNTNILLSLITTVLITFLMRVNL
ncbi:hypothetical protein ACF0H5_011589 [Mactra antiquata]